MAWRAWSQSSTVGVGRTGGGSATAEGTSMGAEAPLPRSEEVAAHVGEEAAVGMLIAGLPVEYLRESVKKRRRDSRRCGVGVSDAPASTPQPPRRGRRR